jgi:RNA recognition motif-containing protein
VENIHPSVSAGSLRNFFEAKNVQLKNLALAVDPITRFSLGYAYFELFDRKDLVPALRENGKKLLGRRLRLFIDESLPLKLVNKWSAEKLSVDKPDAAGVTGEDSGTEEHDLISPRWKISTAEREKLIEFIKNPPNARINKKIAEFLFETACVAATANDLPVKY